MLRLMRRSHRSTQTKSTCLATISLGVGDNNVNRLFDGGFLLTVCCSQHAKSHLIYSHKP